MISAKVQSPLAIPRRRAMALLVPLALLVLLVPSAPSVRGQRAHPNQQQPQQRRRHEPAGEQGRQYQLPTGHQFGDQHSALISAADASIVADLLGSFSERQALAQAADFARPSAAAQQQQQHQHGTPGHYEFEVAPNMEPPSAPRPPFKQANHVCPGTDLFGGFSPRDTLCGDLYQGRVPLNPMGQSVNEQAYPFELIKNKTLQFLAKSLPVLKSEYETIPKVARYLPANQLLNPTSLRSPLGHAHFHELNQNAIGAPPFLRRRKRNTVATAAAAAAGSAVSMRQHQASITVAEMMPNATLVVSSAHSAGRIGNPGQLQHHQSRSADGHHQFAMITRDGYRPIGAGNRVVSAGGASEPAAATSHASAQNSPPANENGDNGPPPQAPASGHQQQQNNGSGAQRKSHAAAHQTSSGPSANGPQANGAGQQQQQQQVALEDNDLATGRVSSRSASGGASSGQSLQAPNSILGAASTIGAQRNHANGDNSSSNNKNNNNNNNIREPGHLQARSASHQQQQAAASANSAAGASDGQPARTGAAAGQRQPQSRTVNGAAQPKSDGNSISSPGQQQQQQHLKCSNVNGLLLYTVCQAASALVEPSESAPGWLQAAKQIGSLYSAASSTDSYGSPLAQSSPLWSLWNAFASTGDSRSSETQSHATGSSSSAGKLSAGSSVASMINLINPLMSFFAPSLQRTSDSSPTTTTTTTTAATAGSQPGPPSRANPKGDGGKQLSSNLRTLSNVLLTGLSLAGLYDWLGASTSLFAPTSTTFARRKKPFEPGETFVDTPASLAAAAAAAAARQLAPGALSAGAPIGKQPPTPCPSVEEYISPTFARNYQGAWKYVVQIPHEGYFTQTIQRSSCLRQKCDFTEGVCHEAPRWVSLLVAEIYYPNAIFGANGPNSGQGQPPVGQQAAGSSNQRVALAPESQFDGAQSAALLSQLMAAAPSTSSLQQAALANQQQLPPNQVKSAQDPLQMTDSLNTYNHNLNSAFFNAATELGLDPTNVAQMQQLANAHNYQLMQRNGLQPQIESRASHADGAATRATQQAQAQYRAPTSPLSHHHQQQQQQQQQQLAQFPAADSTAGQQVFSNDYIRALAIETLRQNPHLSIDDLIKSLQLQQARKKRDLTSGADPMRALATSNNISPEQQQQVRSNHLSPGQNQHHHHNYQLQQHHHHHVKARSSPPNVQQRADSLASLNELGSSASQQQQSLDLVGLSLAQSTPAGFQVNTQTTTAAGVSQQQQQQQHQQHNGASSQASPMTPTSQADESQLGNNIIGGASGNNNGNQPQQSSAAENHAECDGYDKIGCYVVRVYYDWFLVNGSCKCWKTNPAGQPHQEQHQTGSGSSNGGASLIRRIFTG